jgi:hypothetical protein
LLAELHPLLERDATADRLGDGAAQDVGQQGVGIVDEADVD